MFDKISEVAIFLGILVGGYAEPYLVLLAITPMISTLPLMENANSESEVLGIGISVIMLNLGMYLGVPAVVVVGIRKITQIN
jgi:hypothetical protein